ncbi:MAG: trypsin-like peptidase domain-containing protein, partial [Sandaracinaceae bacterium]|nr:trypsin-like peptidase domain-containing protein [Sandaracinaceae bacterium]MDW8247168.1 trypsin-like peptidase domain-containing protein [Sandaracinaceae bacterium]
EEPPTSSSNTSLSSLSPLSLARALSDAFHEVATRVSPAVVSLRVASLAVLPFFPFGGPRYEVVRGNGSGVIVRGDGWILTNRHVIDQAQQINVVLQDGRRFLGRVAAADEASDLAIVRIDANGLPWLSFADEVRVGEWVLAIGSPYGLDTTVTVGVVSAYRNSGIGDGLEEYVQTDASIHPGNSGGPLVNLDGRIVGINTMVVGRGGGIGLAISAPIAREVVEQVIQNGTISRSWIGVLIGRHGQRVLFHAVDPNGPAGLAGVRPGDVLVAIDNQAVNDPETSIRLIRRRPAGSRIVLDIERDGMRLRIPVITAPYRRQPFSEGG